MAFSSALLAIALHFARAVSADPCNGALAASLRQEMAPGDGDLLVSLEFRGGAWQLEVRGAGRGRELHRTLALPRGECELAARTAALATERYVRGLRDLPALQRLSARRTGAATLLPAAARTQSARDAGAWAARDERARAAADPARTRSPREPARAADTEAAPALSLDIKATLPPARAVVIPRATGLLASAPVSLRGTRLIVSTGAAAQLGGDDPRGGLWLDLTTRTRRWAFSVSLAAAAGEADTPLSSSPRGEQPLTSGMIAVSAKPCVELWVTACAGPFLGARAMSGITPVHGLGFFELQAEVGGAVQISVPLTSGFDVAFALFAGLPLGHTPRPVAFAAPGSADLTLALTVGYQIF